jgi:hypothetical protein
MIGLMVLALQVAAPSTVVNSSTITRFQTTAETQPMILRYNACLRSAVGALRPTSTNTAEAQANSRVAACADIRKWALSTGSAAYRRDSGGDLDGHHYMETSLAQVEQGFLAQARFIDGLVSGKIKPSDLGAKAIQLTPNGMPR